MNGILEQLKWGSLKKRRKVNRLILLYKGLNGKARIPTGDLITKTSASVICIPGSLGAGDSGDIAGPKCMDLTFNESRQCRRCAGVLISRQNANLFHILTRGKLSLYICTVWSVLVSLPR